MVNLLEDDKVAGFKKAYDCGEFDLNTENLSKKFKICTLQERYEIFLLMTL